MGGVLGVVASQYVAAASPHGLDQICPQPRLHLRQLLHHQHLAGANAVAGVLANVVVDGHRIAAQILTGAVGLGHALHPGARLAQALHQLPGPKGLAAAGGRHHE